MKRALEVTVLTSSGLCQCEWDPAKVIDPREGCAPCINEVIFYWGAYADEEHDETKFLFLW